jgi:hypothetical protein
MMARDKLKRVEEDERIRKGMRFHWTINNVKQWGKCIDEKKI